MAILPKKINLVGTRGDDLYYKFTEFTIDGTAYPGTSVPSMYIELEGTPLTNFTAIGTLSGTDVTFKIPATENQDVGILVFDVEIIHAGGDKFTHIIGQIDISADVNKT